MTADLPLPTPLQYFAALVADDAAFPLLEAAASLGQDEYPEMDVQQVLNEVDRLLDRLKRRLPDEADPDPLQRLRALNQLFYRDLGFGGNVNHYHDPDNSYLHVLLGTRRGIPVSLAVLWMELAQGVGLDARGVSFPGHFLVKVHLPLGIAVIDPFSGESIDRDELAERLEPWRGANPIPEDFDAPLALYLQASPPREIIARMLRNLKEIHQSQEDWERLVAVQDRLIVLLPQDWHEYRDRGLAYAELGHAENAVADLLTYLDHAGETADRASLQARLTALRNGNLS